MWKYQPIRNQFLSVNKNLRNAARGSSDKVSYANSRYACAARPLNDVFTRSVRAYVRIIRTLKHNRASFVVQNTVARTHTSNLCRRIWYTSSHEVRVYLLFAPPPLTWFMNSATSELNFLPCKQWRENRLLSRAHPSIFHTFHYITCTDTRPNSIGNSSND